jgi:hypothetical protein
MIAFNKNKNIYIKNILIIYINNEYIEMVFNVLSYDNKYFKHIFNIINVIR